MWELCYAAIYMLERGHDSSGCVLAMASRLAMRLSVIRCGLERHSWFASPRSPTCDNMTAHFLSHPIAAVMFHQTCFPPRPTRPDVCPVWREWLVTLGIFVASGANDGTAAVRGSIPSTSRSLYYLFDSFQPSGVESLARAEQILLGSLANLWNLMNCWLETDMALLSNDAAAVVRGRHILIPCYGAQDS
nr:hypothetical protein CFP56_57887 [Quercus suber]